MLSTPFGAQVKAFSAFSPPADSPESLLCPVGALKVYIEHSASYRKSEQLFVGFGNRAKGGPVTKQSISRWLVDAISLAYSSVEPNPRRGPVGCPCQTFVRRPAGPRCPHM